MRDIEAGADMIDVRDIMARVEALEGERELACGDDEEGNPDKAREWDEGEEGEELKALSGLLSDLCGYGGDEQWRGSWYPITLIQDSYFEDYARELAEDIGAVKSGMEWPYTCIDWERAARDLQSDYSTVEYGGVTYWYR